jgi:plasmid maintenance system antidote protein VapI
MIRIPTNRKPTHPGEMLLEEFLEPMGITQKELATSLSSLL